MTSTDPAAPSLSQELAWCNHARLILKKSRLQKVARTGLRHNLKKELEEVEALFSELAGLVEPPRLAELRQPFSAIAADMRAAEGEVRYTQKKAKLEATEIRLKQFLPTLRAARDAARQNAQAKAAYDAAKARAARSAAPFKIHPELHSSLQVLIDATDREVAVGTIDAYKAATAKLGTPFDQRIRDMEAARETKLARHDEQLHKRGEADAALITARETLNSIRTLPGVDDHVAAYENAIDAANADMAQQKNIEAISRLEQLASRQTIEAASAAIVASAPGDGNALQAALRAAEAALVALAELQSPELISTDRLALSDLSNRALNGETEALSDLQNLQARLETDLRELQDLDPQIGRLISAISDKLDWLRENVGADQITVAALDFDRVQTDRAGRRLREAEQRARELLTAVESLFREASGAVSKLRALDLPGLRRRLQEMRNTWPGGPDLPELTAWLYQAEGAAETDPVTAVAIAETLIAQLDLLDRGAYGEFRGLQAERDRLEREVQAESTSATSALDRLASEVAAKRSTSDADGEVQALEDRRRILDILQTWGLAQRALTEQPTLEAAADQAKERLRAIATSCASADVDALASGQDQEAAIALFDRERIAVQSGIDRLETLKRREAAEIERLLDDAIVTFDGGRGDVAAATRLVQGLKQTLEVAIDGFLGENGRLAQLRASVANEKKKAETSIKALHKKLGGGFLRAGDFKPFIDKLDQELEDIEPLLGSSSESGIEEARRLYVALQARATKLASDMDSTDVAEKGQSFVAVIQGLAELRKILEDDELKSHAKGQLALFQKQLEGIEELAHTSEPSACLGDIRTLKSSWNRFLQTLETRKVARDTVLNGYKGAQNQLKSFDKSLEYTKLLKSRLDEIKNRAGIEGKEELALELFNQLLEEVGRAASSPQLRQSHELRLLQEAQTAREQARELTERLEVAKGQIAQAREVVKAAQGDMKQIEELVRLRGGAKDKIKQGDYDGAARDLDLTQIRAQVVIKNPHGAALGARRELQKQLDILEGAIREFSTNMAGFPNEVQSLDTDGQVDASQLARLRSIGEGVAARFQVSDMKPLIKAMAEDGLPAAARRRLREQLLTVLRREHRKVTESPAMTSFRTNSIDPVTIPQSIKKLDNSIQRLVGNVQRSVQ